MEGAYVVQCGSSRSYFGAIVQPLLKSVYDNKKAMEPYVKMNFYDVNAKLVHRFSETTDCRLCSIGARTLAILLLPIVRPNSKARVVRLELKK